MFGTKKHRRFLMHLVGHHVQINIRQTYVATEDMKDENNKIENRKLYAQVGVMLGYFQNSCTSCLPNVCAVDRNGDTVYVVIRPIQAGQQLFISNRHFHWNDPSFYHTLELYRKCKRCREELQPSEAEILALSNDPDYDQFVEAKKIIFKIDSIDRKQFDFLKKTCVKLLKKYGNTVGCIELKTVVNIYMSLLKAEIGGVAQSQDRLNNNSD